MSTNIEVLKKSIETEVFLKQDTHAVFTERGVSERWLFDFRKIILHPEKLSLISDIFAARFGKESPFQIGCLESAGIPLAIGYALKLHEYGQTVNTFFIRKSRKKSGLLGMVEGDITEERIILVDDVLNSGKSFIRQIEVLEAMGKKVDTVFALVRYHDISYYSYFYEKGITVESLFTLDDFSASLGLQNLSPRAESPTPMPFTVSWCFQSEKPNYYYVLPKSAPIINDDMIYFGSDSGIFWALRQSDASVVWSHKVIAFANGKTIFSTPLLTATTVYFGGYDGNFYALNSLTGKVEWIYMEADWIGSSPCISEKHNMVYVGLEFGLFCKRGGIVGLDAKTGVKKWEYSVSGMVHASPLFVAEYSLVVCGSNDNSIYALDAKTGVLRWEYKTDGEVKAGCAYDAQNKSVVCGSFDGGVYILDAKTGVLRGVVHTHAGVYATPLIHEGRVYVASLDKMLYCIDGATCAVVWTFAAQGRIFASPEMVDEKIYIGANDGRFYELDADTGKATGFFQATERITNKAAYNKQTETFFVPTFANELYALKRTVAQKSV